MCEGVTMTSDKQHCQHIGISGVVETSGVESVTDGVNEAQIIAVHSECLYLQIQPMCRIQSDCCTTLQCLYPHSVVSYIENLYYFFPEWNLLILFMQLKCKYCWSLVLNQLKTVSLVR